ncbi:MAG: 30S ribosome-binding factor RbfA [Burkholderiales bacterium]|nr:30S ribosome-binding factor RbfA [Burkholderiales bacterium]OUT78475.1 MAG: ribosome-binding factor A [Betaproteobacteria bacterium TMED22]
MAKSTLRAGRLRDYLLREISELVRSKVRDPRVGQITITDVEVSPDGSFARVYFTRLGDDQNKEVLEKILNNAQGFVRSCVAKNLNMRVMPNIAFKYDDSMEHGDRISRLLAAANLKT